MNKEELLQELAELEELELQEEEEKVSIPNKPVKKPSIVANDNVVPSYNLPSVPTSKIQVAETFSNEETDEERALRELQASMLA